MEARKARGTTRSPLVWLELARAHSALGAALAVWVGGRLGGAPWEPWWLAPMGVSFLLSAAGNAFNDGWDVAIDRINRPGRPIPRGAVSPREARLVAYFSVGGALLLALPFGSLSILGTAAGSILLFLYTTHLKRIPLVGNATVGLLAGMALGYGGLLAGQVAAILLPAAAFGLLFGGREVLKTIHDLPGDRANGLRTLATRLGARRSAGVATLCFVLALLLLALWGQQRPGGWIAAGLTSLAIGAVLVPLWQEIDQSRAVARALARSKAVGLILLLAFSLV